MLLVVAWLASLRVRNYERGGPDDRRTNRRERQAPLRRLPVRRVDADPAARPRRRRHALLHLLRVPRPVHRHGRARARPPAARLAEVPARPRRTRRYTFGADLAGVVFLVGIVLGDRAALRAAALPHPHQDQARGRGHPRHVPRHRRHRLLHRGRPHRARRPARVREVVVHRLPALEPRRRPGRRTTLQRHAPVAVGRPRRRVPRVPRDPARPPSCATCSRRR